MSLAFPLRNREIIKDSIKVRTLINEYIPLSTCRFVLIEIDGNQRFLQLSCILNQVGSTVKIQKETTRVHVLSPRIGMTGNVTVPFVLSRTTILKYFSIFFTSMIFRAKEASLDLSNNVEIEK